MLWVWNAFVYLHHKPTQHTMLSQLEWALPRLDKTVAASVAHRVHTFLLAGQSANIECTSVQLGLIARDLCQHVNTNGSNHFLTIMDGGTVVILQTPIQTTQL